MAILEEIELEAIEKALVKKRELLEKVKKDSTKDLLSEIQELEDSKRKLTHKKNKVETVLLERLLPIVGRIFHFAVKINSIGNYTLWVDFYGHVKLLSVSWCEGSWYPYREKIGEQGLYLLTKTEEEFEKTQDRLLEIEAELIKLLEGDE